VNSSFVIIRDIFKHIFKSGFAFDGWKNAKKHCKKTLRDRASCFENLRPQAKVNLLYSKQS